MSVKQLFSIMIFILIALFIISMDNVESANECFENEIECLIAQLVSPNPPPDVKPGRLFDMYPENYDENAQLNVILATEQLQQKGLDAFPYLIRHLHDKRYSDTYEWGNATVGDVCFSIITSHFPSSYSLFLEGRGVMYSYPDYYFQIQFRYPDGEYNIQKFEQWWQERSQKTKREIHREILEWYIEVTTWQKSRSITEKFEVLSGLYYDVLQLPKE